jgi:hypothetical protein
LPTLTTISCRAPPSKQPNPFNALTPASLGGIQDLSIKYTTYSPDHNATATVAAILGIRDARDGLLATGNRNRIGTQPPNQPDTCTGQADALMMLSKAAGAA